MGIDITIEDLIRLSEVPNLKCLPPAKNGKRISLATIYRWTQRGTGGVRLETLKVGGTTCTSVEALQRYFDELTYRASGQAPQTPTQHFPSEEAIKHLDEMIFGKGGKPGKMDAEMTAAMKDPKLAHMAPRDRRRHLEIEKQLDEAGI